MMSVCHMGKTFDSYCFPGSWFHFISLSNIYVFFLSVFRTLSRKAESSVFRMIDELYFRNIISPKLVVQYIYSLLAIQNEGICLLLCRFLKNVGQVLESEIKDVELYVKGMTKLGRKLDWFKEFKTLDDAFDQLKELSLKTKSDVVRQKLKVGQHGTFIYTQRPVF